MYFQEAISSSYNVIKNNNIGCSDKWCLENMSCIKHNNEDDDNTNKSTQRVYDAFEKGLPPTPPCTAFFHKKKKKKKNLPGLIAYSYDLESTAPFPIFSALLPSFIPYMLLKFGRNMCLRTLNIPCNSCHECDKASLRHVFKSASNKMRL